MKMKYSISAFTLAGALFLFSCGSDDTSLPVCPPTSSMEQVIALTVEDSGDSGSRAGRVLTSSEAANDVDRVEMAVYRLDDNLQPQQLIFIRELSWKDSVASGGDGPVHINLRSLAELAATKGLPDGRYCVTATGYTDGHAFTFSPAPDGLSASAPIANAVIPANAAPEEIFAGDIPLLEVRNGLFAADEDGAGFRTVTMRRQVAGTLGYFSNIPSRGFDGTPATHLRLVASGKSDIVRLGGFNSDGEIRSIVNGAASATLTPDASFSDGTAGYTVYETLLTDWFPNGDVNGDGLLNDGDANYNGMSGNWKVPAWLDSKLSVRVGTIFCSSFVVPFLSGGTSTLQLQLIAKDSSGNCVILRHWSASTARRQTDIMAVEATGTLKEVAAEESETAYSILRNHLYSMGKKALARPNPDTPADEDEPEALNKGEIIVVTINDSWEEHHRLVIKPQI